MSTLQSQNTQMSQNGHLNLNKPRYNKPFQTVVGSYRTLSFSVILGPARHRKTPNENFTVAHVPVCQLKTLVTYMNILWLLEQGEIKKLPKTGEKPWFLMFLELKSNHRFPRLNGNVVVNIQANIVVLCVHIALHAKIRF